MKDKMNAFKEIVANKDYTVREAGLTMAVIFLAGILIGMIFSPRKKKMTGCYNGNYSGNSGNKGDVKVKGEKLH